VLTEVKTNKSRRTIRLPVVCITALRARRDPQLGECLWIGVAWGNNWELVFREEDGSPLSRHDVTHRIQRLLERRGISKHRFHDFRHRNYLTIGLGPTLACCARAPEALFTVHHGERLHSRPAGSYGRCRSRNGSRINGGITQTVVERALFSFGGAGVIVGRTFSVSFSLSA